MYVAEGSPLGRAFSWFPLVHFSPGRVLRPSLGGQVEAEGKLCGWEYRGEEPKPNSVRLSQLACGMLWLSGYGPIWSQNATDLFSSLLTLLEQLGSMVSKLWRSPPRIGMSTWGLIQSHQPRWGFSEFRRYYRTPEVFLPAPHPD